MDWILHMYMKDNPGELKVLDSEISEENSKLIELSKRLSGSALKDALAKMGRPVPNLQK